MTKEEYKKQLLQSVSVQLQTISNMLISMHELRADALSLRDKVQEELEKLEKEEGGSL